MNQPTLGQVRSARGAFREIYTMRGWVPCETREDLKEEKAEIESLLRKEVACR